ncbi:Rho guanine nucleotide exchange factor 11 [Halotydeus destructor]|nr:Rho guanine nucleotide exchange factor 11 [Halotydeus destructor]
MLDAMKPSSSSSQSQSASGAGGQMLPGQLSEPSSNPLVSSGNSPSRVRLDTSASSPSVVSSPSADQWPSSHNQQQPASPGSGAGGDQWPPLEPAGPAPSPSVPGQQAPPPQSSRTVIVQKDENGFGLRVSGDNPVFVESVRDHGAAYRAGVRAGDRIIKVNGALVTKAGHQEVVRLIMAGGSPYVSLQLLGRPPQVSSSPSSPPSSSSQASTAVDSSVSSYSVDSVPANSASAAATTTTTGEPAAASSVVSGPQPANWSTLVEVERTKEKTIKAMIKRENQHLKSLQLLLDSGQSTAQLEQQRQTTVLRLSQLKQRQLFLKRARTKQHLLTGPKLGGAASSSLSFSHPRGQQQLQAHSQHIMSMDPEEEEDDDDEDGDLDDGDDSGVLVELHSVQDVPRTPSCLPLLVLSSSSTEVVDPLSPLLFLLLVDAGQPQLEQRKDWLFEAHSLFLVPDSPLRLSDSFRDSDLNRVYDALNSLQQQQSSSSSTSSSPVDSDGSILAPFVETAQKQLQQLLLGPWNKQLQLGMLVLSAHSPSSPSSTSSSSVTLHSLLNGCFSNQSTGGGGDQHHHPFTSSGSAHLGQVVAQLVQGQVGGSGGQQPLVRRETDLIPLSRGLAKPPLAPPPPAGGGSSALAPFLLFSSSSSTTPLSSSASSSHSASVKRHKSLPNSSSVTTSGGGSKSDPKTKSIGADQQPPPQQPPANFLAALLSPNGSHHATSTGGAQWLTRQGHVFAAPQFAALSSVAYCSACLHLLWGKPLLAVQCTQCLSLAHSWCFFKSAQSPACTPCPIKQQLQQQQQQVSSASATVAPPPLQPPKKHNRVASYVFDKFQRTDRTSKASQQLLQLQQQQQQSGAGGGDPLAPNGGGPTVVIPPMSSSSASDNDDDEDEEDDKETAAEKSPEKEDKTGGGDNEGDEEDQQRRRQRRRKLLRQRKDILRELLRTEKSHVHNLQLLDLIFYRPCRDEGLLSSEELAVLFANHGQLLQLHTDLWSSLKRLIRPVLKRGSSLGATATTTTATTTTTTTTTSGSTYVQLCRELAALFQGPLGAQLAVEAAAFCCRQAAGHELLRLKQQRSYKFLTFLSEAESHASLRRLRLKDLLATCFQRVTKYPLLLQTLHKSFSSGSGGGSGGSGSQWEAAAAEQLGVAVQQSRLILQQVNQRVKEEDSRQKLALFQQRTQVTWAPLPPALQPHQQWAERLQLVHEGPAVWRITKSKLVDVHLVLTDQLLLVLSRESSSSSSSQPPPLPSSPLDTEAPPGGVSAVGQHAAVPGAGGPEAAAQEHRHRQDGLLPAPAGRPVHVRVRGPLGRRPQDLGGDHPDPGHQPAATEAAAAAAATRPKPLLAAAAASAEPPLAQQEATSPRVGGAIRLLSAADADSPMAGTGAGGQGAPVDSAPLLDFKEHVTVSCVAAMGSPEPQLSPLERLRRLERHIRDQVGQRRALLHKNRDETDLDPVAGGGGGGGSAQEDDLLTLVCQLELSTLQQPQPQRHTNGGDHVTSARRRGPGGGRPEGQNQAQSARPT